MIGEYFLDQCLSVVCCSNHSTYKKIRELCNDIRYIIDLYKKQIEDDKVPLEFKTKLDITYLLCKKVEDRNFNIDEFLEKLGTSKYKDMVPILHSKKKEFTNDELEAIYNMVSEKKKLFQMTLNTAELNKLLSDIETGNYEDTSDITNKWEQKISDTYSLIRAVNRTEMINNAAHLDLLNDDYTAIMDKYTKQIDNRDIIQTGYEKLDSSLPTRGFEKRRLYIFGGSSGVGKSALLINLICNAMKTNTNKETDNPNIYLYITCENLIDESLIRFYCCLTGVSSHEILTRLKDTDKKFDIKSEISTYLKKYNSNVIFYYAMGRKVTLNEIEAIIDNIKSSKNANGKPTNLKAVYLDYLDLIRSGNMNEEYRIELGTVTQGFKNFSIAYDICFVTATQLNRSGYESDMASLTQIGESIRKVEDADFICFLQNITGEDIVENVYDKVHVYKKIRATILKNRNGESGQVFYVGLLKTIDGNPAFNYTMKQLTDAGASLTVQETGELISKSNFLI